MFNHLNRIVSDKCLINECLFNFFYCLALDINLGMNSDEMEEKERMIQQVLELQNTLDGLKIKL